MVTVDSAQGSEAPTGGVEHSERVQRFFVVPDLKMQVRPGGVPGGADSANRLASLDGL